MCFPRRNSCQHGRHFPERPRFSLAKGRADVSLDSLGRFHSLALQSRQPEASVTGFGTTPSNEVSEESFRSAFSFEHKHFAECGRLVPTREAFAKDSCVLVDPLLSGIGMGNWTR
uniref:Uncharacterized protein n=1 Tax=Steinernema glaseri TaxID=37863 RepID=A0A1I7YKV4_9BILA